MKKKNLITIVVAIATTSFLISCSSDDSSDNKPDVSRHERVLTITQNIDESSVSKIKREITDSWNDEESANGPRKSVLIDQGEAGLKATWEMGDEMTVYNKSYPSAGYAIVKATSTAKNTTFMGAVDCEEGDVIRLFYPKVSESGSVTDPTNTGTLTLDISSQKGTLEDIQQHYDFNYGQATVTAVTNETATANAESTENLMAICKFTFKCDNQYLKQIKTVKISGVASTATYTLGARNTPQLTPEQPSSNVAKRKVVKAPEFGDEGGGNTTNVFETKITVSAGQLDNSIYVTLFPGAATPTFIITTKDGTYEGTLPSATLAGGKFYNVTINTSKSENTYYSDEYVEICGIKWARGNLQYDPVNGGDEGFVENWRIAPTQWHFVGYDQTAEYDPSTEQIRDNFIWGFIGDKAIDYSKVYSVVNEYGISCCLYYQKMADDFLTEYHDLATYGDLAYWASYGKYRLPRASDFASLIDLASYKKGYVLVNGIHINGLLFTNPDGERTTDLSSNVRFDSNDLEKGLFLPCADRVYYRKWRLPVNNIYQNGEKTSFNPISGEGFYLGAYNKVTGSTSTTQTSENSGLHFSSTTIENKSDIIKLTGSIASSYDYYYYKLKIRPILCE